MLIIKDQSAAEQTKQALEHVRPNLMYGLKIGRIQNISSNQGVQQSIWKWFKDICHVVCILHPPLQVRKLSQHLDTTERDSGSQGKSDSDSEYETELNREDMCCL